MLKSDSQYGTATSVALGVILGISPALSVSVASVVSGSIISVAFASVQPIKLLKIILNSRRSQRDAGASIIL